MADSNELVVFMTLPRGVEEAIIPGVLASRNVPFVLVDRYLARQGQHVEVQVPSSRLKDARQALADAKKVGKVFSVAEKTTYQDLAIVPSLSRGLQKNSNTIAHAKKDHSTVRR